MAREISDKQPVARLVPALDKLGQPVSQPVAEYRTITAVAGEVAVVSIKVNGLEVATLGPVVMPAPRAGKLTAVQVRMLFTDSAASLKVVVPETLPGEERG